MNEISQLLTVRVCTRCGLEKEDIAFRSMHRRGRSELKSECRACESEYYRSDRYKAISRRKNAKYRAEGRFSELDKRSAARRKANHPEKVECNQIANKAIQSGKLVRPDQCDGCGEIPPATRDGRAGIQAHHDDYSRPLDVRWLCHKCHVALHRARSASPKPGSGE